MEIKCLVLKHSEHSFHAFISMEADDPHFAGWSPIVIALTAYCAYCSYHCYKNSTAHTAVNKNIEPPLGTKKVKCLLRLTTPCCFAFPHLGHRITY